MLLKDTSQSFRENSSDIVVPCKEYLNSFVHLKVYLTEITFCGLFHNLIVTAHQSGKFLSRFVLLQKN